MPFVFQILDGRNRILDSSIRQALRHIVWLNIIKTIETHKITVRQSLFSTLFKKCFSPSLPSVRVESKGSSINRRIDFRLSNFIQKLMAAIVVINYQLRLYSSKIPSIAANLSRTEDRNFHWNRNDFFKSFQIEKINWHRFPTLIITTTWGKCSASSWLISIQEGPWHTCHQGGFDASLSGPY